MEADRTQHQGNNQPHDATATTTPTTIKENEKFKKKQTATTVERLQTPKQTKN